MADFLKGPLIRNFPLWSGEDITFIINRKDPETQEYIDYAENTTAKIVFNVDRDDEVTINATITGHEAQFLIDDASVSGVKTGSKWKLQFTISGLDKAPVIGRVNRKDAG